MDTTTFFYELLFFIVQIQLSPFSHHYFPLPHPPAPLPPQSFPPLTMSLSPLYATAYMERSVLHEEGLGHGFIARAGWSGGAIAVVPSILSHQFCERCWVLSGIHRLNHPPSSHWACFPCPVLFTGRSGVLEVALDLNSTSSNSSDWFSYLRNVENINIPSYAIITEVHRIITVEGT